MRDNTASRRFWRALLHAGGFTPVPRWTATPVPGVAEHTARVPDTVVAVLRSIADELSVSLEALLLAAHAKVIAAVAGEDEIAVGYAAVRDRVLPCRVDVGHTTWRTVVSGAHAAVVDLRSHQDAWSDDLLIEAGSSRTAIEVVFDPTAQPGDIGDQVLRVVIAPDGDRLVVRARVRTDALDVDSAVRIVGYHLSALGSIAADVDAEHGRQSLLSPDEIDFQINGLAGPAREVPDCRAHELFEARAGAYPDAVAAVHGSDQWTYGELNARANRLGRVLLTHGLQREGVVAVVTERNLDWMAAVIAVFKAGGVYLPIEPHFPADRIATTLRRAGCSVVLTERGSTVNLDTALDSLPGVQRLLVDEAYASEHTDDDLGVEVDAEQLAYIYFTSGSTGEPKGAMCEHAGMLNHLFAKIDDLAIGDGDVVAQVAPQCFDISLWQLVSAVLVGGRTVLVEQDVILDVERFLDTIVDAGVNVVQVVPSYLEAVLASLEQRRRDLPDLRCVSVTGEALKVELTQRWFDAQPRIKLVNAYGLTETSDDTNHEVMDAAPRRDLVPLGRPVNNVHVYVVDEELSPVPLGAPGEIVFSGVCVGRGYINDPERTRLAFGADPHRPGERLYRAGDFGRWLPDGKLEFLGRRDAQVKIRGFRIEIGEIENALLQMPGVRDGAVVVVERADESKHLVAFYAADRELEIDALADHLAESLPEYMVPATFHWRERLPLTANSKIDKKMLTGLAAELDVAGPAADDLQLLTTAAERRVATAWASVLGIAQEQVGRLDHFFERGGTSLSAVKLVTSLDRAVSLKDVTANPILADLARLVEGGDASERPPARMLQPLGGGDAGGGDVLVCFPHAGGNAVNFLPLADALRGRGIAVHAVELPGHALGTDGEPFAAIDQIVERIVPEIVEVAERTDGRILLWGHSSGAAPALATAVVMEQRAVDIERVFIGAQLLGDAATRRAAIADLTVRSDDDIVTWLRTEGQLGDLDAGQSERIAAAYRHDCIAAHRYFVDALDGSHAVKVAAPVTVVVAVDDASASASASRYRDWECLAAHVELHQLDGGGHYFLRTRPADAATAVVIGAASSPGLVAHR